LFVETRTPPGSCRAASKDYRADANAASVLRVSARKIAQSVQCGKGNNPGKVVLLQSITTGMPM
jgi:hypothetical protein